MSDSKGIHPQFITFTGVDEYTSIGDMIELSRQYAIEWGVLISPIKQGCGRYPPIDFVKRLTSTAPRLSLSAHLCGSAASAVIAGLPLPPLSGFLRAQINSRSTEIDTAQIGLWGRWTKVTPILQCRTLEFPSDYGVQWLFDQSGGKGIRPKHWPRQLAGALCGYAGGIDPDNVRDVLADIDADNYWIDIESGVRDENDRFSLEKCRKVCEVVYST